LEARKNLLFIGQTGTGKTHLSVAIALSALAQGKTVLFTTVWDMINRLQQSRADLSYQRKIQTYLKPDLLILDELGYRSMAERTVEDFFEIISKRYEKGSLIVTTNRELKEWDKVFIDKTLTSAIVDRLLHHSRIIEIRGESYRHKHRD
jgi:DNA replication protein DnaC